MADRLSFFEIGIAHDSAKNQVSEQLYADVWQGSSPRTAVLQKGDVLFDIAREALLERAKTTKEATDKDAILRECNRIMVLNGYEDAHLDGKSNLTTADLPKSWNNIKWGQEFKLYANSEQPPAVETQTRTEQPRSEPRSEHGDPNDFFICQFRDSRFNPGGPASSMDCGPASLAMIAKYYGAAIKDPSNNHVIDSASGDPAELVSTVRLLMTGGRNSNEGTGLGQIEVGAKRIGFDTEQIASLRGLDASLAQGHMVILAGNPKHYQKDLGLRYGKGGTIYDGGHFITVVARDGDSYIVNDPASHSGSMTLTLDQIEQYVSVNPNRMGLAVF